MKKSALPWGIHWFRRDLRLQGNPGLAHNYAQTQGRTLGVFFFDSQFLGRPDFSHDRFAFFLDTLQDLRFEMQANGGDLLIVDQQPQEAWEALINLLNKNSASLPSLITWNRDYEPFAIQRDTKVKAYFKNQKIPVESFRDHLLIEPHELPVYQIYTPFSKRWGDYFETIKHDRLKNAFLNSTKNFELKWSDLSHLPKTFSDAFEKMRLENRQHISIPIPKAGSKEAQRRLSAFQKKIQQYEKDRDIPSLDGTSGLAPFLKNGSLTSAQILAKLKIDSFQHNKTDGAQKFLREIIWREFYYSILFHHPSVETQSYRAEYRDLSWQNNLKWFERWKEGTTGFPIVDAGMRELLHTGKMHNRVRMIVASFLTKDLLIDWRWGENYFMKKLLDGDLAANNGGWQWAASTGCDPQPYFRIFNPWLQSEKFDPEGLYIKTHVPELRNAPPKALHQPEYDRRQWGYPAPLVDHKIQRMKALNLYKKPSI